MSPNCIETLYYKAKKKSRLHCLTYACNKAFLGNSNQT